MALGVMIAWGVACAVGVYVLGSMVGGSWSGKDHGNYGNPQDMGEEDEPNG